MTQDADQPVADTPAGLYADVLNGLWRNNPGLVQFLGLCPLLAVSNTLINGLGLGLATLLVLTLSNFLISGSKTLIPHDVRLPVYVLIIASLVTATELVFKAQFFDLYLSLGIFIPLIVTNCAILARAESFAFRNSMGRSVVDGLAMGTGFALLLIVLGGLRELIGRGSLFSGAEHLFGPSATGWEINLLPGNNGLLIALLPPGAFIGLALLVAGKNVLDAKAAAAEDSAPSNKKERIAADE